MNYRKAAKGQGVIVDSLKPSTQEAEAGVYLHEFEASWVYIVSFGYNESYLERHCLKQKTNKQINNDKIRVHVVSKYRLPHTIISRTWNAFKTGASQFRMSRNKVRL